MIEEEKGRKGRGRNVAFHHLLLSNLTTVKNKLVVQPLYSFLLSIGFTGAPPSAVLSRVAM